MEMNMPRMSLTITEPVRTDTISLTKAENLFWLGRYTQRVYTILHFFRKFRTMLVDVDINAYQQFCDKLGIENKYMSVEDFSARYLFDRSDRNSLISALTYAHSNGIVLRGKIKSETLSYIQLCISYMENCHGKLDANELQPVTDGLMAFWGSVDERIFKRDIRNMIKAGWYLETLDLHIRFDYPYERLVCLLERMERHIQKEKDVFDLELFQKVKKEMAVPGFNKLYVVAMIEGLFVV